MQRTPESELKRIRTTKERHGKDIYKRAGSMGGKHSTRGYFGYLKDTNPEKLKNISKESASKGGQAAALKRRAAQSARKEKS